jgi:hypothetical protein
VTEKNDTTVEIKARIAADNRCPFAVQKILHFRMMSRNAKLLGYKMVIRTVVMYASKTRIVTEENERALNTWEIKIMEKISFIHFPVVPIWNIGPLYGVSVITHTKTHGRTPLDE